MTERDKSPERAASESEATSKTVFVVMRTEDYEGGHILNVYHQKERAERYAEKYVYQDNVTGHHPWVKVQGGWKNGCDRIEIEEWPVK